MPPSKYMHMKVIHRLPAIRPRIHHQPIPVVEVVRLRNLTRRRQHLPEQPRILRQRMRMRGNVPLGDHQHMHWRLGTDVRKGERLLCFVQTFGRDLARDNLAKKAVWDPISHERNHTRLLALCRPSPNHSRLRVPPVIAPDVDESSCMFLV